MIFQSKLLSIRCDWIKDKFFILLSVEASVKSPSHEDEFDYIVTHTMSCKLEKEDLGKMVCDELRFGLFHEVMKEDVLEWIGRDKVAGFE